MIGPNGLPHPGGHPRQGDTAADIGAGTNLTRRDADRDPRRDADPQKGDRFGKALQKALAAQRAPAEDDPQPVALALALPQQIAPQPLPDAQPAPAPVAQHGQTIADRIDRYLRSAEAQSGLRDGQSMTIRLPTGPMGLSHVTVTMRDGVLQIALAMQAATAGAQAQLSLLGQAIAQRQPKLAFHLSLLDEDDEGPAPTEPFNPLMPQRKPG